MTRRFKLTIQISNFSTRINMTMSRTFSPFSTAGNVVTVAVDFRRAPGLHAVDLRASLVDPAIKDEGELTFLFIISVLIGHEASQ